MNYNINNYKHKNIDYKKLIDILCNYISIKDNIIKEINNNFNSNISYNSISINNIKNNNSINLFNNQYKDILNENIHIIYNESYHIIYEYYKKLNYNIINHTDLKNINTYIKNLYDIYMIINSKDIILNNSNGYLYSVIFSHKEIIKKLFI